MVEYALMVMVLFTTGWLVVYVRQNDLLVRGLIVTGLIVASLGILQRVERYRGQPRAAEVPADVLVHGFVVDEGHGIVYLYCGNIPPESLIVPYVRPLHEALQQGRQQFEGKSFRLIKGESEGEGEGDGEGEGEGEGEGDMNLSTKSEPTFRVELPSAVLPKK